ncbi:MAG: response regulator [Lachnospiraceae bacterium]|nr:response regulator [Lachnospiraceae bacterium]
MKSTLDLLKDLLNFYFIDKDAEKVISLMSDDIHSFSENSDREVQGIDDIRSLLGEGYYKWVCDSRMTILGEESLSLDAGSDVAVLNYIVERNKMAFRCRLTGNSKVVNGERKLCVLYSLVEDLKGGAEQRFIQAEVEALNERYMDLLANVDCGVAIYRVDENHKTTFEFANEGFCKLCKGTLEDVLNAYKKETTFGIAVEDRQAVKECFYKAAESGEVQEVTYRAVNLKDEKIWATAKLSSVKKEDCTMIYATFFDVSSSMEIQEKLRQNEKTLEAQFEMERQKQLGDDRSLLGYVITNVSQNRVLEHKEFRQGIVRTESGYTLEEAMEIAKLSMYDEETGKRYMEMHKTEYLLELYQKGITSEKIEIQRVAQSGEVRWTRSILKLLHHPDTGEVYLYEYAYDIHKEKMLEEIMTVTVACGYERCGALDLNNGQITLINIAEKNCLNRVEITDYAKLVESYAETCVVEEDREKFLKYTSVNWMRENMKELGNREFTYKVCVKGESRYMRDVCTLYDAARGICLITRSDVTERVLKAEEKRLELEKALETAKNATKAKTEFLARMSHDMRTPMNAIIGLNALAMDDIENPKAIKDNLEKIRSASDFLLGLINDVLDMSKIEAGSLELHKVPYGYSDFLSTIKMMFEPLCQEKGIHFEFEDVYVRKVVMADKTRLNQIFFNILSNAVKYTPEGGRISYYTENIKTWENHISADYIVEDSGIGISEEFQKTMFQPFSQEENLVTPELQGTGLGLSITKSLVELMGGTLRIDSRKGEGTRVTIHLSFEVLDEEENNRKNGEPADIQEEKLVGKRILIVEDHPLNAQIVKRLLEKKNAIIYQAEDGKIALDKFETSRDGFFDAILMDIRMPNMNGLDATRAIRALDRTDAKKIPIIAMTANAYAKDVEACKEAGMNVHLGKPIEPEKMYKALCDYLPVTPVKVKPKLLIVDDQEINQAAMVETLKEEYDLVCAKNGLEALEKLAENMDIEAVITDIQMPVMDGIEFIQKMRANPKYDSIAILANTQYGDGAQEDTLLRVGADDFVYKPTSASITMNRLKNILHKYK